ncbi:hypothetical protein CGZ90_00550 [Fictibacillus aquaticus]|uniref:Uncharacterized protein n=1 Tax=Fictibacillus aquaticus TaxID=2021314 RepID=A0A235FBV3_9BACL|nr:hypothetical protein CGZ90_00550 [Fictibacillus aquaticus]
MTLSKLVNKSLITCEEFSYSMNLGLPVEVYCPVRHKTIAFGRIISMCEQSIVINDECHPRDSFLFFGCPCS